MAFVTKRYIEHYVANKPQAQVAQFVGRALVVLFNNQTEAEKAASTTNVDNGVGFTGADAHSGCITAKYFLKHGTLLDWQIEKWTKRNRRGTMRLAKYWRQLDEAAKRKRKPVQAIQEPQEYLDRTDRACQGAQKEAAEAQRNLDADWREQKARFAEHERQQEELAYKREMEAEDRMEAWLNKLQNS